MIDLRLITTAFANSGLIDNRDPDAIRCSESYSGICDRFRTPNYLAGLPMATTRVVQKELRRGLRS